MTSELSNCCCLLCSTHDPTINTSLSVRHKGPHTHTPKTHFMDLNYTVVAHFLKKCGFCDILISGWCRLTEIRWLSQTWCQKLFQSFKTSTSLLVKKLSSYIHCCSCLSIRNRAFLKEVVSCFLFPIRTVFRFPLYSLHHSFGLHNEMLKGFLFLHVFSVWMPTLRVMELSRQLCGKMRRSNKKAQLTSCPTSTCGLEIHFYRPNVDQLEYSSGCYTVEELCIKAAKKCCECLTHSLLWKKPKLSSLLVIISVYCQKLK